MYLEVTIPDPDLPTHSTWLGHILYLCILFCFVFLLQRCKKHHFGMKKTKMIMIPAQGNQNPLGKTWNTLKAAAQVKKVSG